MGDATLNGILFKFHEGIPMTVLHLNIGIIQFHLALLQSCGCPLFHFQVLLYHEGDAKASKDIPETH